MAMNLFYRATVQWFENGRQGETRIPVYAFTDPRSGWFFHWPDVNLDDLKLLIDQVNMGRQLNVCTDSYLNKRAFPGRAVKSFNLTIHDSFDRESAPTEERKVIATIAGNNMTVNKKAPTSLVPRMTCERFSDDKPMQVTGDFIAVTLSLSGNLSFQRR